MAAPSRELSITYGGFKVGGDQTARVLHDAHVLEHDYERSVVEYRFTLFQSTVAALASEIGVAENAFRTPNQDFTVDQGGTALKSFSHSQSTGFNARPSVVKRGEPTDTGRSRTYTVRIELGLPATTSSSSGRRITRTSISVAYSPSRRRTVTISGEYTAVGTTTARANYRALIDAYASSVLTDIGGTYKRLEEPVTDADDTNKTIRFTDTYEEIVFTGVASSNADVRKEMLAISRNKIAPGDTPSGGVSVERLISLDVKYECHLDKENDTDLRGLYSGTLRAAIITQVKNTLESGSVAVVDEKPDFDYTENKISVSMTCLGTSATKIVENKIATEVNDHFGLVLVPAWTGDAYSRYVYQGPRVTRKTVTQDMRLLGPISSQEGGAGAAGINFARPDARISFGVLGSEIGAFGDQRAVQALVNAVFANDRIGEDGGGGGGAAELGYVPISAVSVSTPLRIGLKGDAFDVTDIHTVVVAEKASVLQASSGAVPTVRN